MIRDEHLKTKLFIPVSEENIQNIAKTINNNKSKKVLLIYNFYTGNLSLYKGTAVSSSPLILISTKNVQSAYFGYHFQLSITAFSLEEISTLISKKLNDIYILFFESFQSNKNLFEISFAEIDKRYFFMMPIWNCEYFYDFYYRHKPINNAYFSFAKMFLEENKEFLNEDIANWFRYLK